jgi:hypothetical protein
VSEPRESGVQQEASGGREKWERGIVTHCARKRRLCACEGRAFARQTTADAVVPFWKVAVELRLVIGASRRVEKDCWLPLLQEFPRASFVREC